MDDEQSKRLKELTQSLRHYNQEVHTQFVEKTRSDGYEVDFYNEVKPFADKVVKIADEWKPLVFAWINVVHPKYVYHEQIIDTYDNITISSVTGFQKDTRRKRFLETIKSIDYVLESIENQIP